MLQTDLQKNIEQIKKACGSTEDLVFKEFKVGDLSCAIFGMRGLVCIDQMSEDLLYPASLVKETPKKDVIKFLCTDVFSFPDLTTQKTMQEVVDTILHGDAIIVVDGQKEVIKANVNNCKERSITEPPTSAVLKGPRKGFTENIKTNVMFLRKILATPELKTEYMEVGKLSRTKICVMYVNGIASKKVVKEIVDRIKNIKIDGIIDSFYITSFLEEHPRSMFKQVGSSEKPDIIAAKILEGRVAVFVDGSPIVLTLPFILVEDLQNSDDYYTQHARATFLRILRIVGLIITTLLPGLYISIQLYHYKAIPLKFLVTLMNTTQGLPLTPFAEILFVLALFEILYEASLRMPKYLGLALSIVGALILGDTAVKAGLISPPAVMIMAVSGITLYTVPDEASQLSLLRLVFTVAGGILGFFGVVLFGVFMLFYLSDFDNYGAAYLAPFSPYYLSDYKDAIFKSDVIDMQKRPLSIPKGKKADIRMKSKRGEK